MNTREGQVDLLRICLSHLSADGTEAARLSQAFPSIWGLAQEDPLGLEGDEWDQLVEWVENVQAEGERIKPLADGPAEMASAYFNSLSSRRVASERERLLDAVVGILRYMGSLD